MEITNRFVCFFLAMIAAIPGYAETYFFHNDHLGTPQVLTDSTQKVVWKADYDTYGKAAETVNDIEQNIRFPGQYFDRETGLHYNYFRIYNPETGRYTTSDPLGLAGGLSTYSYVSGNPISRFDPLGLDCISFLGKTHCSYPGAGGVKFTVPTPSGFPTSIKNDGLSTLFKYHNYHYSLPTDGASAECLMRVISENPTPRSGGPAATAEGTDTYAPFLMRENSVTSYLRSDANTAGAMVVNVTTPNSMKLMKHGYVARTVSDGYIHTYGEGMSLPQSNIVASLPIPAVIQKYYWESAMRDAIDQCRCRM